MRITVMLAIAACVILAVQPFRVKKMNEETLELYSQAKGCNITHFQFQTNESIAVGNDFMKSSFERISARKPLLNNVTWKVNDSVTYVIYDAQPQFQFFGLQFAEIMDSRTILIHDMIMEVTMAFKWEKQSETPNQGSGEVHGFSEKMAFGLRITNDDYPKYELIDNVNYRQDQLTLTTIDKPITPQEKQDIIRLLNSVDNVTSLRQELMKQVNYFLPFYLKMAIDEDNNRKGQHFTYIYKSSMGDQVINLTRKLAFFTPTKRNISTGYELTIDGFNSDCGPAPPTKSRVQLNPAWGQNFISSTFMFNFIRAGIEKKALNVFLSDNTWPISSSMNAQIYSAGSLFDGIGNLSAKFAPTAKVTYTCLALKEGLDFSVQVGGYKLNLKYNCSVEVDQIQVMTILLTGKFVVRTTQYPFGQFNLMIDSTTTFEDLQFVTSPGYYVKDQLFLKNTVREFFEKMVPGTRPFGHGFPFYLKLSEQSIVEINPDYTFVSGFGRFWGHQGNSSN